MGCNELATNADKLNSSSSQTSSGQVAVDIDMESLNKNLDDLEVSIAEVENQMSKVNVSFLSGQVPSGSQKGVVSELKTVLDRLVTVATLAFSKVDELRAQIDVQLAKLDPANPLHQAALLKLNEALTYLDALEVQLRDRFKLLVSQIGKVVKSIDDRIAAMDPKNPLTIGLSILWGQVRAIILDFEARLLAI